jgi:hypothetical protein
VVPDEPDEPDPGTNVAMPAVRHESHAEPAEESAHEKSASIDVQFSSQSIPVAKGKPSGPRRQRAKTIPDRITESLTHIPVVKEVIPKSRKGRVLFRSVIVAFALVGAWISVIVYFQLRGQEKPDFRPQVEAIFVELRDGKADEVYAESSQRFQELMVQEAFETHVQQMNEVLGPFVEVASVIKTEMFRGPSGRTARVEVLLEFEKGRARAALSFHQEGKVWRMMGYGVDVPPEIAAEEGTQERRQARVQDKALVEELRALTDHILGQSREGKAGAIWDEAAAVFRQSITRTDFIELEQERHDRLGPYNRILAVTTASTNPSKTAGSLDLLIEFRHPQGGSATTTGVFKYEKDAGVWKLTFYKLIMPLPRDREPVVE